MKSLRPVLALIEICYWRFITFRINPLSPTTARAVIRINELERPAQ